MSACPRFKLKHVPFPIKYHKSFVAAFYGRKISHTFWHIIVCLSGSLITVQQTVLVKSNTNEESSSSRLVLHHSIFEGFDKISSIETGLINVDTLSLMQQLLVSVSAFLQAAADSIGCKSISLEAQSATSSFITKICQILGQL